MALTPETLFAYADAYAQRREDAGEGTVYPTFRTVAKRFSCSYDAVEDACNSYSGSGYLAPGVGIRVGGTGGGVGFHEHRGYYVVEAYA